jgi:CubicO group peptidase (beta-lactamase class C family)
MSGEGSSGVDVMRPGLGFGFDVAVITDAALVDEPSGTGTYRWDGAAGTIFWVDPANDVVFVGMVQRTYSPDRPNLGEIARQTLYQALIDAKR